MMRRAAMLRQTALERGAHYVARLHLLDEFSYASEGDSLAKRALIRAIESVSGQPKLKKLYYDWLDEGQPPLAFWQRAIEKLELDVQIAGASLDAVPRKGALVVVANHPYGVLDGIVLCWLVAQIRPDFKIMLNDVLCRVPEVYEHMLPVDFEPTKQALQTNLASRRRAREVLEEGGCVVVFPSGAVSTTPHIFHHRAAEFDWAPLTGQLIRKSKADVLPIYFGGQNSLVFQVISHISLTLRQAVLFHEVRRRMGTPFDVVVGDVLPYAQLAEQLPPPNLMRYLQEHTMALPARLAKTIHSNCDA